MPAEVASASEGCRPARPIAVVLDGYTLNPGDNPWTNLEAITELTVYDRTPPELVVERAANAEIVFTNKTPLSAEAIESLPNLRFISVLATGYNVVNLPAAKARNIPVSNVPTYSTDTVAQHTVALLLELSHHCGEHSAAVREGEWSRSPDFCFWRKPLIELAGKTLGIVGFGRIGRRVATIAEALGMRVCYYSRHVNDHSEGQFVSWDELLRISDVISLHCALTPESERMINRDALTRMKPTALVINTSRGALVDEADLADALRQGVIAGAAVDVLTTEPPRENPLLAAPNCIITPHMAWSSREARRRLTEVTVENVRGFLRGAPINVVR